MHYFRLPIILAGLAALVACQPKAATGPASSDTSPPVATVNGAPISRDFYEFYIKGITQGKSSAELTPQQRAAALDNLIRARLVGEEAAKQGLDKVSDNAYLLELSRLNVLQQAVEQNYLKDRKPTDTELRAEYETQIQAMPKTEYHARHILLANEADARKVIERLDKGEKFETLAKAESLDPSKSAGGDLGWFSPERMMPEFAGAVIAMKPNEYTHNPVHTQYGWHVIQLLDTREVSPPTYDQVKGRLEQIVQAKKFRSYTDDLMKNAKVEKLIDQPSTPAAPGAAPAPATPAPSAAPNQPAPAPAQPAQPAQKN